MKQISQEKIDKQAKVVDGYNQERIDSAKRIRKRLIGNVPFNLNYDKSNDMVSITGTEEVKKGYDIVTKEEAARRMKAPECALCKKGIPLRDEMDNTK